MGAPYPLFFEPMLLPKVWGGDRLARFGKPVKPGDRVGESWELADMGATSASGAGGSAVRSVIANGALRGKTLHEAMELWGAGLLGNARPTAGGNFPLLVKFLDARENLSVQVHPSPAYAAAHPGAHLKTESWVILQAEPGSLIYKGIKPGVTREQFEAHIREGSVAADLYAAPAIPGECHNLPSGTCHALGAGVVVAEVQTPSDTTFRVYDWGRAGRELHVKESLECIEFGPAPGATRAPANSPSGVLVTTPYFRIEHIRLEGAQEHAVGLRGGCVVVMMLAGQGTLYTEGERPFEAMNLATGRTVLLPAACAEGALVSAPSAGRCEFLMTTLP